MSRPDLARLAPIWDSFETAVIGMLTLVSLLISIYAIASRYLVPQYALDWPQELVVYLITWAFWLAGARAVMDADHVKADLLVTLLSAKWRRRLAILQDSCAMLFCLVVMLGGIQVVQLALQLGERSDSSLALPMWIYYSCLPVGFVSISARYAIRISSLMRSEPEPLDAQ